MGGPSIHGSSPVLVTANYTIQHGAPLTWNLDMRDISWDTSQLDLRDLVVCLKLISQLFR